MKEIENINLINYRKFLGLNQIQMAKKLNVSTSYYIKIELGDRNPSYNFIKKFKDAFKCNIDEIFFEN